MYSKLIKYTILDDKAWDLFVKESLYKNFGLITFKAHFFCKKNDYPYSSYYEEAKQQLRLNKLNKIMSNVFK